MSLDLDDIINLCPNEKPSYVISSNSDLHDLNINKDGKYENCDLVIEPIPYINEPQSKNEDLIFSDPFDHIFQNNQMNLSSNGLYNNHILKFDDGYSIDQLTRDAGILFQNSYNYDQISVSQLFQEEEDKFSSPKIGSGVKITKEIPQIIVSVSSTKEKSDTQSGNIRSLSNQRKVLLDILSHHMNKPPKIVKEKPIKKISSKRKRFTIQQKEEMNKFIEEKILKYKTPYISSREIDDMSKKTGLNIKQLRTYFTNYRQRKFLKSEAE